MWNTTGYVPDYSIALRSRRRSKESFTFASRRFTRRLQDRSAKKNTVKSGEELAKQTEAASVEINAFKKKMNQEKLNEPTRPDGPETVALNARHRAHLLDATNAARRVLDVSHLPGKLDKELQQKDIDEQRQDEEDMSERELKTKNRDAKHATVVVSVYPEEELRRGKVAFLGVVLECCAKLGALSIGLKQAKRAPVAELDHMSTDQRDEAEKKQEEMPKVVDGHLLEIDKKRSKRTKTCMAMPVCYALMGEGRAALYRRRMYTFRSVYDECSTFDFSLMHTVFRCPIFESFMYI